MPASYIDMLCFKLDSCESHTPSRHTVVEWLFAPSDGSRIGEPTNLNTTMRHDISRKYNRESYTCDATSIAYRLENQGYDRRTKTSRETTAGQLGENIEEDVW